MHARINSPGPSILGRNGDVELVFSDIGEDKSLFLYWEGKIFLYPSKILLAGWFKN